MPEMLGPWERVKDIGSGGFGMVVLWRNVTTDQRVAIKQCRWGEPGTEALMTAKVRERWQKEVEIMLKLNHRGIVSCMPLPVDLQTSPTALPRLCMEYCEGGDLRRVLLRPENCCGLPELEVRRFLSDITDALGYLHGLRIIHRDLKPENVVLQKTSSRTLYKLIDLGYAKELDQTSVCTSFVGTLQYLAPELFLTNRYTCTADYWSLGLVAHEVVTGVRPFLPNMTPAMWMRHVSQKGRDDICAEELEDGSIRFHTEITLCNQVSVPLRHHLEAWLRLLLDWEPRRRGRAPVPASIAPSTSTSGVSTAATATASSVTGGVPAHGVFSHASAAAAARAAAAASPVVVFAQLQELLRRRVVAVFSEPQCQLMHAEIADTTTMAQLQEYIARETGLPPSCQQLCLPSGGGRPVRAVDTTPSQSALQCWAPPEETDWVLYVFDNSGSAEDDALSSIPLPPLVRDMLQDTDQRPEYYRQRAVFAQSVFMIQRHLQLLHLREKAQHVHMMSLAGCLSRLSKLSEQLTSDLARLQAASELFLQSLACDDDSYQRQAAAGGVTSDEAHRRWRDAGEVIRRRMTSHGQRAQQLTNRVAEVTRQGAELRRVPAATGHKPDELRISYERACQAYENHRRRPKEQRSRCTRNEDMIRIVAKFLMHRDQPFKQVHTAISEQQRVERCALELFQPVSEALVGLQRGLDLVTRCQRERQSQIWSLMRIVLHGRLAGPPAAVSDSAPAPAPAGGSGDGGGSGSGGGGRSVEEWLSGGSDENSNVHPAGNSSAADSSTAAMVSLAGLLDSATLETSDAVSANHNLHAEISDLLRKTELKVPPPDGEPIDWSFLN